MGPKEELCPSGVTARNVIMNYFKSPHIALHEQLHQTLGVYLRMVSHVFWVSHERT